MSHVFGNDPWENGWAADDDQPSVQADAGDLRLSAYVTLSQLLSNATHAIISPETEGGGPAAVPTLFSRIRGHFGTRLATIGDLETLIFDRLVASALLTRYQATKIIDDLYDHDLLPPLVESNLYQALGLVSLELDVPGQGDYVTLLFRVVSGLPELPNNVVELLLLDPETAETEPEKPDDFADPLSSHLANTSLTEDDNEWANKQGPDPVLADHSAIQQTHQATSHEPIEHAKITAYVNDIRDRFKPLVGSNDAIKIKEVPEKEGLLFKHINYIITHSVNLGMNSPAGAKKVIRRYSDFVWYV